METSFLFDNSLFHLLHILYFLLGAGIIAASAIVISQDRKNKIDKINKTNKTNKINKDKL